MYTITYYNSKFNDPVLLSYRIALWDGGKDVIDKQTNLAYSSISIYQFTGNHVTVLYTVQCTKNSIYH